MPQASQPVSTKNGTTIVSAKGEDVSKWRKYAVTYYRRSIKPTSSAETKQRNREEYEDWRDLLEAAGYNVEEGPHTLTITAPKPDRPC